MNSKELLDEFYMSYEEQCEYLKKKYGEAQFGYFTDESCRTKCKDAIRTDEGLICHHIWEKKYPSLSHSVHAKMFPFEVQKKEALVYCNYLEHLVLHMKALVLRLTSLFYYPEEVFETVLNSGVIEICAELNDMFLSADKVASWRQRCFEEISQNEKDYFSLMCGFQYTILYLCSWNDQYVRRVKHYLTFRFFERLRKPLIGMSFSFGNVLSISENNKEITIGVADGEETLSTNSIPWLKADVISLIQQQFCAGYSVFNNRLLDCLQDQEKEIHLLMKDHLIGMFKGHGYPEFSKYYIRSLLYGYMDNADGFISLTNNYTAVPAHRHPMGTPVFWAMKPPEKVFGERRLTSVLAIEAKYELKSGETPLVPDYRILQEKNTSKKKVRLVLWNDDYEEFLRRYEIVGKIDFVCGCYFDPDIAFSVGDIVRDRGGNEGEVQSIRDIKDRLEIEVYCGNQDSIKYSSFEELSVMNG